VRQANIIYVIENGKLCEQGTHAELIDRDGLYATLWKVQNGLAVPKRVVQAPTL